MIRARWVLPATALVLTAATVILLSYSVGSLRTRAFFERTIRRIESLDRRGEYDADFSGELREAARHARTGADWRRILQLAWKQPEPARWDTIQELAATASGALPEEGRWKTIGAYAALRLGRSEQALATLEPVRPAGETVQHLRVLASIDRENPRDTRERMTRLLAGDPGDRATLLARALGSPDAESLRLAWEETGIEAFALNAALSAAAEGKREDARSLATLLQESVTVARSAIYLAAWLQETDWLFRQLRRLPPRESVSPEIMLLQADGHLRHAQWDEARRIYLELQAVSPALSPLVFTNDAVLASRIQGDQVLPVLERGDPHHREDRHLQLFLAGTLVRENRTTEARERLERLLELYPENHEAWLLLRLLTARESAARGAPPERLESDLWTYLNNNHDAFVVASHLARMLFLRGNAGGLAELRRRYAPDAAPWAAAIHADHAIREGRPEEAAVLLAENVTADPVHWTDHYNRALLALQFPAFADSTRGIEEFRRWLERYAILPENQNRRALTHLLLLEAEAARLGGDERRARTILEEALSLNPDQESLYSYRARIAPRD